MRTDLRGVSHENLDLNRALRTDSEGIQFVASTPSPVADDQDAALARVEAALERIASGGYGYCLECGEELSIDVLEDDPTSAICKKCSKS